jgi:hypothetical protein
MTAKQAQKKVKELFGQPADAYYAGKCTLIHWRTGNREFEACSQWPHHSKGCPGGVESYIVMSMLAGMFKVVLGIGASYEEAINNAVNNERR